MGVKYPVDETFFDTWSDEMAYVLGFMFADGHIGDYEYFRGKYINFSNTEKSLVYLIKNLLGSEHEIYERPIAQSGKILYRLRIGSKYLFKRLLELGVTPRKSLTMKFPSVPKEFFGSFLLGYFDGDGCVHVQLSNKKMPKGLVVIFTGASRDFLEVLQSRLAKYGTRSNALCKHGSTPGTFQLRYYTRDSLRIYLCMYQPQQTAKLGLERKYAIFNKYLKLKNLTHDSIPLVLDKKGPVVNGEHIGLQNQHERVRLPPGPQ